MSSLSRSARNYATGCESPRRTTPALVEYVDGDTAHVLLRPLFWNGRTLELGPYAPRDVRWRDDGLALAAAPGPGET